MMIFIGIFILVFYDDLYADRLINLSEEAKEIIRSFFEAQDPTDIGFDIITNDALLYRGIPLQIGSNLDIAAFSIEPVRGIFAAMQDAGLEFTSNGLAITNGNFLITNSNNEAVLNFNKDDGTLSVTGQINATSGYFSGELRAATGTFSGEITATTGTIGGFNILENSIESIDGNLQLFSNNLNVNGSLIKVKNIYIGDGGVVDGQLEIGNLKIINPNKSGDDAVLKLEVPNDAAYFKLTNQGYILGKNWSIMEEPANYDPHFDSSVTARFGRLVAEDGDFTGTIRARDGVFTGEVLSSIITASTINTANFVTEKTRSMGGSFIFKPTFEITNIVDKGSNNVEFTLSENSNGYFSVVDEIIFSQEQLEQGGISFTGNTRGQLFNSTVRVRTRDFIQVNPNEVFSTSITTEKTLSWRAFAFYDQNKNYTSYTSSAPATVPENTSYMKIVLATNVEGEALSPSDIESFILKRVSDKIVAISGFDTRFGKITSVDENKIQVELKEADYNVLKAENALENYKTLTLFGSAYYDTLIGINSDDTSTGDILPPRALTMETFTSLHEADSGSGVGDIDYNLSLLLGDLSTLKSKLGTEFNYIDGYGLYADNVFLHGSLITEDNVGSYAGIHTFKDVDFSYQAWGGGRTDIYTNEKIIFWGGANSLSPSDIQQSPFIVTDKGSIFASRGEFKGAVIADSIITDAIIQTPVIYGSGSKPSLKIYDTNSNNTGIGFYKLVGNLDLESNESNDILTLNISNLGFTHYQGSNSLKFIDFNESNNNIYFYGTSYNTGTTILSSRQIKDQTGKNTAAIINITGSSFSDGSEIPGNIELNYASHGVKVTNTNVLNFGGQVINEGEVIFQTASGTRQLDYKTNSSGYYCLFVS